MDEHTFTRRILKVAALAILIVLCWALASVLLLVFAGVIVAVLLRGIADNIRRILPVNEHWSVALAVVALAVTIAAALAIFGFRLSSDFATLSTELPKAWQQARTRLDELGAFGDLLRRASNQDFGGAIGAQLAGYVTSAFGWVINVFLIAFGGLYFAVDPGMYRNGVASLFQASDRRYALRAFDRIGGALWKWLLGQFIDMSIVGVMTGFALWLIGLPTALALGLFAGLASFVPYVGPIVGIAPALVIALSMDLQTALWVLAAYVVIQLIESYVVQPLVQERMVKLPPALLIFSIAGFALLFGIPGVLLAAPLTVLVYVAVREFYLRDTLGEPVDIIARP